MTRVTSADQGYQAGDLSVFPSAVDTKETLYQVSNNAATLLKQALPMNGTYVVVEDASGFPPMGLICLGPYGAVVSSNSIQNEVPGTTGETELIYYGERTDNTFKQIIRGYAASRQNQWGANTSVTNSVVAEAHNAVKDAIINMENYLGTKLNPNAGTIAAKLNALETKLLTPTALFKGYPTVGKPSYQPSLRRNGLIVNFKSMCTFNVEKFLWDFGDGITSTEKNPIHIYTNEGYYTVTLNIITNINGQGITTKKNYIYVSNDVSPVFLYAVVDELDSHTYHFTDQTDGEIVERIWVFGDGTTETVSDPDIHTISHTYPTLAQPTTYSPNILLTLGNQIVKRGYVTIQITVA